MTNATYSQCGEDRIVVYVLAHIGQAMPINYIDAGSSHPIQGSNSYLFYAAGSCGVLVEADPKFTEPYARERPRDSHVQAAVVPKASYSGQPARFYISATDGWSTTVQDVADRTGKTQSVLEVPTVTLESVAERITGPIHLLSVDLEGLDAEVLKDLGPNLRPWIVIAENDGGVAVHLETMKQRGYKQWATTAVNSIYVAEEVIARIIF